MHNLLIPSPETLETKLSRFTPATTRVVTDFDSTVTKNNGKTSWGLFSDSGLMPAEYVARRNALKEEYYPYEISTEITDAERGEKMREWWMKHLALLQEFGLRRDILDRVVTHAMTIRSGMDSSLRVFHDLSIPVLVLSAGITQSIESVLAAQDLLLRNISIASNSLLFDADSVCVGTDSSQIIHVCNKDEWDATEEIQATYAGRVNILLFGDSLDDIKMIRPEERENAIAVGFCTSSRSHQLEEFKQVFDIVVESDDADGGVTEYLLDRIRENNAMA